MPSYRKFARHPLVQVIAKWLVQLPPTLAAWWSENIVRYRAGGALLDAGKVVGMSGADDVTLGLQVARC